MITMLKSEKTILEFLLIAITDGARKLRMAMKDMILGCLHGNKGDWNTFFKMYDQFILRKVKQAFIACGSASREEELRDAYDFVVDQLLYGKVLQNFHDDQSFEGFLATVVRRKTIDWLRQKTSESMLYGQNIDPELTSMGSLALSEPENSGGLVDKLSDRSRLIFKLYLIRYHDFDARDLAFIKAKFAIDGTEVLARVERLRASLEDRFARGDQGFFEVGLVFAKLMILQGKNQSAQGESRDKIMAKVDRKRAQYEKCIAQYQKHGFEEFPRQKEMCEILSCHRRVVEKMVDGLKRELKEQKDLSTLSEQGGQHEQKKSRA